MTAPPFGYYAPDKSTFLLRLLTKLGVSRGAVKKWIRAQWKNWPLVDITVNGIKYRLHVDKNVTDGKILTSSKFYDGKEIAFIAAALPTIPSDSVFVDIGANTGYYTLNAAKMGYTKIIAVEPNPPVFNALLYNIRINQVDDQIDAIAACIGRGDTVSFYAGNDWGSSSIVMTQPVTPIIMQTKPLLEILHARQIKHVNALKIDIEGYEDKALLPFFTSAPATLWPQVVVIEHSHRRLWANDIIDKMIKIGYVSCLQTRGNLILRRA